MYIGSSRNQWNSSSAGNNASSDTASDKIYNDFIFRYSNKGKELKNATDVEIGMVIERVKTYNDQGTATGWATGSTSVSDMNSYRASYSDSEVTCKSAILSSLNSSGTVPSGCIKATWNTSDLNSKNFLEQSYSVYSQYGQTVADDTSINFATDNSIDNYVYRAYAYMKYDSTENGTADSYVLSDPSYFCMRYTSNLKYSE